MIHKKNKKVFNHWQLTKGIEEVIRDVIQNEINIDRALEKVMKGNRKWDFRDRTYVYETCSDMIRYWRLLSTSADITSKFNLQDFYKFYTAWFILRDKELPHMPAFKTIETAYIEERLKKYSSITKIRESYPDWLDDLCHKSLGKDWSKMMVQLNKEPKMVLRANTLKISVRELQDKMNEHTINTQILTWSPYALELEFRRNVFRLPEFKEGLFEVQDAASQMVADFLQLKPGMRVVDACAGTGGKSLNIAAIMQNKGSILALDTKEHKLNELKKRAKRAGVSIIEPRCIDTTKVVKRLANSADRLLLDVPCTGLGVLRRHPDAKWKLKPEEVTHLITLQKELLERFAPTVKQGGKMVYATCSILPEEGEGQVKWFIEKHGNEWKLEGEKRYSPIQFDADGFYMALLTKQ